MNKLYLCNRFFAILLCLEVLVMIICGIIIFTHSADDSDVLSVLRYLVVTCWFTAGLWFMARTSILESPPGRSSHTQGDRHV